MEPDDPREEPGRDDPNTGDRAAADPDAADPGTEDADASGRDDSEAPPVARRRRSWVGGAVGAVAGVAVIAILLVTGHIEAPRRFSERDATDDFMRAWQRSRTSTFVVDSEWKRVKDNGETLSAASRVAQQPPRRVTYQVGGITGEIDGKQITCFTAPDGVFACNPQVPLDRSFEEGVQQEMKDLNDHFRSTNPPIYRVRTDDHGCYELVQTRAAPNPTFGRLAQVCFDDATGAIRYSERHFENVTEYLIAQEIRPAPTDADFQLNRRSESEVPVPPDTTAIDPGSTGTTATTR